MHSSLKPLRSMLTVGMLSLPLTGCSVPGPLQNFIDLVKGGHPVLVCPSYPKTPDSVKDALRPAIAEHPDAAQWVIDQSRLKDKLAACKATP